MFFETTKHNGISDDFNFLHNKYLIAETNNRKLGTNILSSFLPLSKYSWKV